MNTAGIVLYNWKLSIYKTALDNADFHYEEKSGITHDKALLMVKFESVEKLQSVIEQAERDCQKGTMH